MHKSDITLRNISKIEGHADLDVIIRKNKVKDVKLKITENKRFYTQAIRGKSVIGLPQHVSRICGTCSIAHLLCSIEAIEKTLGIKPSLQTRVLRKLSMYGLMIRDHALHLYVFTLPDLLGKDSILELNKTHHHLIHDCFKVKGVGNHLSVLIAGRSVHPPYPQVGGFSHFPDKKEIKIMIKELEEIRPIIMNLLELYSECKYKFDRKTDFVALAAEEFGFIEGKVKSTNGECIEEKQFFNHLTKKVIPYSQAVGYEFDKEPYMVGALARINLSKELLHKNTRRDCIKYLRRFPSINIYDNRIAQGIEIVHCIDHSIELLRNNEFKFEDVMPIRYTDSRGVGVVEAPRGTLYYQLFIGEDGIVKKGTIVTPSQQNQINLANDIKVLVQENIKKPRKVIAYEIEKLIRAYDPCMSCASHFLKIKWK